MPSPYRLATAPSRPGFRGLFAVALLALAILPSACAEHADGPARFPGEEWETGDPKNGGLDSAVLDEIGALMKKVNASGVLIHNGLLVAEWTHGGPPEQRHEVQSITKSVTGTLLGLALGDGLIKSIDDPVIQYYPGFSVGPHTKEITFRHLVTATSGIRATISAAGYVDPGNMPPGLECRYHNDHTAELAAALTYVFGEDLESVLQRRILDKIGARMHWHIGPMESITLPAGATVQLSDGVIAAMSRTVVVDGREIPVAPGFSFTEWTPRDLARLGWLYLNDGRWKDEQLLPRDYAIEARTPVSAPVFDHRSPARQQAASRDFSDDTYGFTWRGRRFGGDPRIWHMSGNGGQFCAIIPEHRLVMVKINDWTFPERVSLNEIGPLLVKLVRAR